MKGIVIGIALMMFMIELASFEMDLKNYYASTMKQGLIIMILRLAFRKLVFFHRMVMYLFQPLVNFAKLLLDNYKMVLISGDSCIGTTAPRKNLRKKYTYNKIDG